MGNFLVVAARADASERADRWFAAGLARARDITRREPRHSLEAGTVRVATFARANGSGGALVADDARGDWLLAIGTWMHESGAGPGRENVLLERLREVDPERLGRELEGFFVVVAGRRDGGSLTVVTDLIASCHAFCREGDGLVAVSGSALWLAGLAPTELDVVAAQEYLQTGIIYEDRSPWSGVRKLPPSSVVELADGRAAAPRAYWSMGELASETLSGAAAVERWGQSMADSARRIDAAFERPVCDLTGGFDSRALAAVLADAGVSFETTVSGPADSADVRISTGLAARCGLTHHHVVAREPQTLADLESAFRLCDGEVNVVAYARIASVHERLSERFDLSLNGSFGEVARGYYWELLFPGLSERSPLDAERIARERYAAGAVDLGLFDPGRRIVLVDHFAAVIRRTNAELEDAPRTFQLDHTYLRMRMRCWQGRIATATNQIWPNLSPFMFRSALEPVLQSEPRARLRGLLVRMLIERHHPVMAAYPLADGYPAMPARLGNLHRFVPLGWLYAKKIARRLVAQRRRSRAGAVEVASPRAALWRDEGVRELLDPSRMKLARYVDPDGLARFLTRSRQPDFPHALPWERLVGLEMALRA